MSFRAKHLKYWSDFHLKTNWNSAKGSSRAVLTSSLEFEVLNFDWNRLLTGPGVARVHGNWAHSVVWGIISKECSWMADEVVDPRCQCTLRQWQITSDEDNRSRRRMKSSIVLNLLLVLLLVFPLLFQPVEPARTINACRKKQRDCTEAMHRPHHVQVTRSNPRRLSSDQNQFNVPAAASRGRHARRSPPSPWANSQRYNASAHEVPSGPNPISNWQIIKVIRLLIKPWFICTSCSNVLVLPIYQLPYEIRQLYNYIGCTVPKLRRSI